MNELSFAIHNAYQLLLNNEIVLFLEMFDKINTKLEKPCDDNLMLLKLINDVKELIGLIEIKSKDISQQIMNTRKQIMANQVYR